MKPFIFKLLLFLSFFFSIEKTMTEVHYLTISQKTHYRLFDHEFKLIIKENNDKLFLQNYCVDSISLKKFWSNFQVDLIDGNIEKIKEYFDFPIQAYYFVLFQFSYDCDTIRFMENEKKYINFEIDSTNFNKFYNFIFSKELIYMVRNTSYETLINNAIISKNRKSLIYSFFAYNYNNKLKCFSDHCLFFYINQDSGKWKIEVGGV